MGMEGLLGVAAWLGTSLNPWTFRSACAAEVLFGLALALVSGADTAVLWETLRNSSPSQGRDIFGRKLGWSRCWDFTIMAATGLLGFWLISLRCYVPAFCFGLMVGGGYTFAALRCREPEPQRYKAAFRQRLASSVRNLIIGAGAAWWLVLFSAVCTGFVSLFRNYVSWVLQSGGWSDARILYTYSAGYVAAAAVAVMLLSRTFAIAENWVLFGTAAVISGSFVALSLGSAAVATVVFTVFFAADFISAILLSRLINNEIRSDVRVTMLSLGAAAFRLIQMAAASIFAGASQKNSPEMVAGRFLLLGILVAAMLAVLAAGRIVHRRIACARGSAAITVPT